MVRFSTGVEKNSMSAWLSGLYDFVLHYGVDRGIMPVEEQVGGSR
jgi:hypothetical protein